MSQVFLEALEQLTTRVHSTENMNICTNMYTQHYMLFDSNKSVRNLSNLRRGGEGN